MNNILGRIKNLVLFFSEPGSKVSIRWKNICIYMQRNFWNFFIMYFEHMKSQPTPSYFSLLHPCHSFVPFIPPYNPFRLKTFVTQKKIIHLMRIILDSLHLSNYIQWFIKYIFDLPLNIFSDISDLSGLL